MVVEEDGAEVGQRRLEEEDEGWHSDEERLVDGVLAALDDARIGALRGAPSARGAIHGAAIAAREQLDVDSKRFCSFARHVTASVTSASVLDRCHSSPGRLRERSRARSKNCTPEASTRGRRSQTPRRPRSAAAFIRAAALGPMGEKGASQHACRALEVHALWLERPQRLGVSSGARVHVSDSSNAGGAFSNALQLLLLLVLASSPEITRLAVAPTTTTTTTAAAAIRRSKERARRRLPH